MKKIGVWVLAACLALCISGCRGKDNAEESSAANSVPAGSEITVSVQEESSQADGEMQESSSTDNSKKESKQSSKDESDTGFVDFSGEARDYTLREFYESPQASVIIDEAKKLYDGDTFEIDITVEGENNIVAAAKFKNQVDPDKLAPETIDAYFEDAKAKGSTYIGLLEGITTTDNIIITARLLNADGTEIQSRTFEMEHNDDQENQVTLDYIMESGLLQPALDAFGSSFADGTAAVTAAADNEHQLTVSVQLQQCVPEEGQSVIAGQLSSAQEQLDAVKQKLRDLTGDEQMTVTVRVIDACGKIIASA